MVAPLLARPATLESAVPPPEPATAQPEDADTEDVRFPAPNGRDTRHHRVPGLANGKAHPAHHRRVQCPFGIAPPPGRPLRLGHFDAARDYSLLHESVPVLPSELVKVPETESHPSNVMTSVKDWHEVPL